MADADHPPNTAVAIFNDDEYLDDEDDDESSDSATSARPPPPQVTIAVPGVTDVTDHLLLQQNAVVKKVDESRKLFQRLWTDEDEIELLQGYLDYTSRPNANGSSHHDTTAFYDQIRSRFQLDFNKNQLVEKLRRLKKKYRNVINKSGNGKEYPFKSPHELATFEISSKIWGNSPASGRAAPAPVDEEDDLNFVDFQNPNGIDMNSKTPRSKKRYRTVPVRLEEKQPHPANFNINNTPPLALAPPPSLTPPPILPISSPAIGAVIEETLKNCLSPIFKELLSNLSNSTPNQSCGPGFGPIHFGFSSGDKLTSPIPFCFGPGDKASGEKWRKQQILELEVFSKRLELMQDEIREQLQDLRSSMGNSS